MIRLPNTIETYTGREFSYEEPEVDIFDVAAGLSKTCRFAGQTYRFYSVAEHSILVSRMVAEIKPDLALVALLHDAHEAYLGDIPTPLKPLLGKEHGYIAERIDRAVRVMAGLSPSVSFRHPVIKWADEAAMAYEASQLMCGRGWAFTRNMKHTEAKAAGWGSLGMSPDAAKDFFLAEYRQLHD